MTVRIVTDSCADITKEEAEKLKITVIPVYLRFGEEVYRDGIDINCDDFYHKIVTSSVHPNTAAPSPGDFAKAYNEVAQETDEIVSIHVTRKHSAVYDAALVGKGIAEKKGCRIEVIDSKGVTMWQGLVAIEAARAAEAGCNFNQVVEKVHETIKKMRVLALLDSLEYVVKGGRLGKTVSAVTALESLLNIKLFITLRDGEVRPAGLVRTRTKGIDRLLNFLESAVNIEEIAVVYSTTLDDAQALVEKVRTIFPNIVPRLSRLGSALGVHAGPGAFIMILR